MGKESKGVAKTVKGFRQCFENRAIVSFIPLLAGDKATAFYHSYMLNAAVPGVTVFQRVAA